MKQRNTVFFKPWLLILLVPLMALSMATYAADEHGHEEQAHEEEKGPHGGKLLRDGDVTLELAIFERGVPPEYRAWITRKGQPIEKAQLTVTLTRLGGKEDVFTFRKNGDYWLGDGVVTEPHSFDVAVDLRIDGKARQWRWQSHEGRVEIASTMAKKVGIGTSVAGPGSIERHVQVYGRLVTPPDNQARIRARFPGAVTEVRVKLGERVSRGHVLATIESNESLQRYELRAPIDGVVQSRTINVGEVADGKPLFTLVNGNSLWAELKVFPGQRAQVKPGQSVHIHHSGHTHESQISHITSTLDGSPVVMARAILGNENDDLAPGDLVSAQIDVETVHVPMAVDNRALQSFRDWTVVFIQVGDVYEIRPLELGRSDGSHTEVLAGLNVGDRYVVDNSYLIKADIEKSGASHDH